MPSARIAVIGDHDPDAFSHPPTNRALDTAIRGLNVDVEVVWVPTPDVERDTVAALSAFAGYWASPGSPYRSLAGMLGGIRFARESGKPFVAT